MKRVDSRRPEAAQSQRERVTAAPAGASALPLPSAPPEKTVAQATRRMTALEERMSHLEASLQLLLEELHGETHDSEPPLE